MTKMVDRWDCEQVVCIKEYETLKVDSHYYIKGRGNLEFNADPNVGGRIGYGLCVEDPNYNYREVRRSYGATKPIWYYFTVDEMNEYFITDEEHYKIYLRDQKIKSLGIE